MRIIRALVVMLLAVLVATPSFAQTGSFFVRLGRDTIGAESYVRTPGKVELNQVGRAPRVLRRQVTYTYDAQGNATGATMMVTAPSATAPAAPFQKVTVAWEADSLTFESRRDSAVTRIRVAAPKDVIFNLNATPWAVYESLCMQLKAGSADSVHRPLYFIGARTMNFVGISKLGRDSVVIHNNLDLFHARVDAKGRILHVTPIGGTAQYTVDRAENLDLQSVTADFLSQEKSAGAMGALSTRDTVRVTAGGAALWIDYGRPEKRGRAIFGGVVPWGGVWRTGANAATQFRTDKALVFGETVVPAGFYTLWTSPSLQGWKLIINGETGQWGTEHKADRDLYTLDMKVESLASPVERFTISVASAEQGGTLNLDWDTTRASIPFVVKP